jgi:hypothetical protein
MIWLSLLFLSTVSFAAPEPSLPDFCVSSLSALPGKHNQQELKDACSHAQMLDSCVSEKGVRIFHIDKAAKAGSKDPKKILVFALIHGDEYPSGSVARSWLERLTAIEPRNTWRIVPILNPDGLHNHTRMNAHGVDLNRNFPTKDWDTNALKYWAKATKRDKRRYPGPSAGSEKETRCAMRQIEEYKPDLILSIHTPYGVLDFDGPKIPPPDYHHIPWKNLGNYPGSLGRYMWVDRSKPTLTIELQSKGVVEQLEAFDRLQDVTGDIASRSLKVLKGKDKSKAPPPKDGKKAP